MSQKPVKVDIFFRQYWLESRQNGGGIIFLNFSMNISFHSRQLWGASGLFHEHYTITSSAIRKKFSRLGENFTRRQSIGDVMRRIFPTAYSCSRRHVRVSPPLIATHFGDQERKQFMGKRRCTAPMCTNSAGKAPTNQRTRKNSLSIFSLRELSQRSLGRCQMENLLYVLYVMPKCT